MLCTGNSNIPQAKKCHMQYYSYNTQIPHLKVSCDGVDPLEMVIILLHNIATYHDIKFSVSPSPIATQLLEWYLEPA